ncbi:MAG: crossover junction endodeoxyribonuclease RuvC, partial [Comamonas sp.]
HAHAGAAMARVSEVAALHRRQHAMYKGGRSY